MARLCLLAPVVLFLLLLSGVHVRGVFLPVLVPGQSCPTSGPINYQYLTTVSAGPFGPQPVISSNWTLAPFSAPPRPIESIMPRTKNTTIPRVCDTRGRCIDAYELVASITTLDVGFRDPRTGASVLSQFLTYDGTVPGPGFVMQQGVQALVRLHNHIFCNTTTMTPINSTGHFYSFVTGLTLHQHGGATLSPFDGWSADDIQACQWKDYVYANQGYLEALWYHDHALGKTAETVGCGLFGTYQVAACDINSIPEPLRPLGPAQYLVFTDQLFIKNEGSDFINPSMLYQTVMNTVDYNNGVNTQGQYNVTGLSGDHILVNGLPWPVVTVQRRPYWFIFHNGAQTRVFNLILMDTRTNTSVNAMEGRFWVVGSEGGLRVTPTQAQQGILMGAGERYQVVIDFSQFPVGTELVLMNPPTPIALYPYFCYTQYVMKFIIDGTEPQRPPFNPVFFTDIFNDGDGQNQLRRKDVEAACHRAMNGTADVVMQTSTTAVGGANVKVFTNMPGQTGSNAGPWTTAMVGTPSTVDGESTKRRGLLRAAGKPSRASTRHKQQQQAGGAKGEGAKREGSKREGTKRGGAKREGEVANKELAKREVAKKEGSVVADRRGLQVTGGMSMGGGGNASLPFSQFLPHSVPTNGWSTWWMFNNASGPGGGGIHPIHLHLVNFYICGRRNNASTFPVGPRDYEIFSPKDIFFLGANDEVAFIVRTGPHQGSYQFHCHNLQHEDDGLMGQYNSTSATKPLVPTTYWQGTLAPERFAGFAQTPNSPVLFKGQDPLVRDYPNNSIVGHNLYYPDSMPPWAQRTDANGRPQPITVSLLRKVLARNYYSVFYPDSRHSLSTPVRNNNYAVMCPPNPRK